MENPPWWVPGPLSKTCKCPAWWLSCSVLPEMRLSAGKPPKAPIWNTCCVFRLINGTSSETTTASILTWKSPSRAMKDPGPFWAKTKELSLPDSADPLLAQRANWRVSRRQSLLTRDRTSKSSMSSYWRMWRDLWTRRIRRSRTWTGDSPEVSEMKGFQRNRKRRANCSQRRLSLWISPSANPNLRRIL